MEDEIRALLVRILKPPQAPFKEFRADGWPFCPKFEEEEWRIAGGEAVPGEYWLADTIDGARVHIPPGFVCLGRWRGDDPVIIEVWV
jgi:hypothetical protein